MRSLLVALALAALAGAAHAEPPPVHGIAMHGAPKYGPDFKQFDYVNPAAPKGGDVRLNAMGTFDTLNGHVIKGQAAAGLSLTYDTLMADSADEAFSEYGRLAETVTMPDDRSWVAFALRREARWHDGKPVTPDDVIFSLETLKTKGAPFYRVYFGDVVKAERVGERGVRFTFKKGENRELPLTLGQMPILPRHYWEGRDFEATTLEPPTGSGPYRIESFEPGRYVVYRRDPAYWGRDLPVNRGLFNFDRVRFDYYRDATVALEGFKAGAYDFREENVSKQWATAYDFPAVADGRVKKEELHHHNPSGMQAFAFNIRRPLFKDPRVRRALAHAFDFEWSNKTLFHGQYARTESYFDNSELASQGLPSPEELELLEPLRGMVPDEVFTQEYKAPSTDGSGNPRDNLRIASALLKEAGWEVKDRRLVDGKSGAPFEFEILLFDPTFERLSLPFARNLERLGIKASVRTVDSAQYKNRVDAFDFDMVVTSWGASLSPGNEQRNQWGSAAADTHGSDNIVGIKNPAVDRLVDLLISAPDRKALIARTRALDRVLLWGHYVIPNWHIAYDRVAYWNKLRRPDKVPTRGFQFFSWWIEPTGGKP
ncbi:MAG: ABC transporter substrate-binding protein [Alphaproteobacteria bacterium]|nr:ABC transporter substrate-binding protein [Alphaproteobacteria bacterium]